MARSEFGGVMAAWVVSSTQVTNASSAEVRAVTLLTDAMPLPIYDAPGGTEVSDFLDETGQSVTQITVLPSDPYIPRFSGPDGVASLWVQAEGGRWLPVPRWGDGTGVFVTEEDVQTLGDARYVQSSQFNDFGDARYATLAALADLKATGGGSLASRVTNTAGLQARGENALTPDVTPTADGSGQTVHPSVVYAPQGWNGYPYWLLITGYAGTNSALENPHLLVSQDGSTWANPPGLTNPIKAQPAGGFNSDPQLVLAGDTLYCFYRSTIGASASPTKDGFYLQTTQDGVTFTPEQVVWESPSPTTYGLVAPGIVFDPASGTWTIWAVQYIGARSVVRMTADSPTGPWSDPQTVTGITVPAGREPWHIHVHEDGGEFVMFFADSPAGTSTAGNIYRAVSRDGLTWTTDPDATLVGNNGSQVAGYAKWDGGLYRPSAIPATVGDAAGYRLWYSGTFQNVWRTGHTDIRLTTADADSAGVTGAALGVSPWLAGDVMNRADNPASAGDLSSGQTWVSTTGTMGVIGRALYTATAANTNALIDIGTPDVDIAVTLSALSSGGDWLVARAGAGSLGHVAFLQFGTNSTATAWEMRAFDNPNGIPVTTLGATIGAHAPAAGDRIRLVVKGARARGFVNGLKLWDVDLSAFPGLASNTRVGVQTAKVTTRFREFTARAA